MDRYVIGINTGGTYTDGVLLDYSTRKVISSSKSLTTRDNLKIGVIKTLKKLEIKQEYDIKLVGISSTLATNTVAEGKGRKAGLLLIGYDQELIGKYNLESKLPAQIIGYFNGGHNAQGVRAKKLDRKGIGSWVKDNQHQVEAIAVSSYFSPLNPEDEEAAFEIIQKNSSLPVVMAHQLSTKLDSIKRASTASINASLVAVMYDFIQSVHQSLSELQIDAPLMIVRGDGTLMPAGEAVMKPVETVMSGPAASAIGGVFLANNGNSLVVDMGSTTTDMAMVHNDKVVVSRDGARVGTCETSVEAARIRTISLGCDSRISHNEKKEIIIGPDRVRPLSQIVLYHDNVLEDFHFLKNSAMHGNDPAGIEYLYLHDSIDENTFQSLDDNQKRVVEFIEKPRRMPEILKKANVYHTSHLNLDKLICQGVIECSTLTPTDLLHADGRLDLWNKEVAVIALEYYCKIYGKNPKNFVEEVFDTIINILVEEMIIFLACQDTNQSAMPVSVDGEWGQWMLQQILHSNNYFLSMEASSRYPVIGAGAPARHFLKRAAQILHAKFILPEHFEVANAVGAVCGSVSETREAIVFVRENKDHYTYIAKHDGKHKAFKEYGDCCEYAEDMARKLAREAAVKAGATDCFIETEKKVEGSLLRFVARAMGNPKLSRGLNYSQKSGMSGKKTAKLVK